MEMVLTRFARHGPRARAAAVRAARARPAERLRSIDVATLPYPGIATDYKPLIITMLSVADGVGIVTENLYPGRFRYVEELQRLGADIRTDGHHAVVRGVPRLSGAPVRAHDIRAGAAMVVAGLAAEGDDRRSPACTTSTAATTTSSAGSRAVGADIERVPDGSEPLSVRSAARCAVRSTRRLTTAQRRRRSRTIGPGHQQDLVPAALVGEERGEAVTPASYGARGMNRTGSLIE